MQLPKPTPQPTRAPTNWPDLYSPSPISRRPPTPKPSTVTNTEMSREHEHTPDGLLINTSSPIFSSKYATSEATSFAFTGTDTAVYILIASAACVCCILFIALTLRKCTRRKYKDEGYKNANMNDVISSPMDSVKHERVHTQSMDVNLRSVQERLEAVMNRKKANESVSADDEDIEQLYVS
eukprot:511550_1